VLSTLEQKLIPGLKHHTKSRFPVPTSHQYAFLRNVAEIKQFNMISCLTKNE